MSDNHMTNRAVCTHVCTELTLADRRNKREIRHLEQELPKWQVLVETVTGQWMWVVCGQWNSDRC